MQVSRNTGTSAPFARKPREQKEIVRSRSGCGSANCPVDWDGLGVTSGHDQVLELSSSHGLGQVVTFHLWKFSVRSSLLLVFNGSIDSAHAR